MKYLLIPLLVVSGNVFAKSCPLEILTNLPESIYANGAEYDIFSSKTKIKQAKSKICIEKTNIGLAAHKFESTGVSVTIKGSLLGTELYTAWIHNPTVKIEVNAVTHIAKALCPNYCGYYEYQALINNPNVIAAAKKYDEAILPNPEVVQNRDAYFAIKNKVLDPIRYLELDISKFDKPSPYFAEPDIDDFIDPYSGSAKYFYSKSHYSTLFRERFFELRNKSDVISALSNTKKRALLKPLEKEAKAILYPEKWQDLPKQISAINKKLEQTGEEAAIEIAKVFNQAYKEVNKDYNAFYNSNSTQFSPLTDPKLNFEDIVANWSRYAYYYAKKPEKFSQLFSENYKRVYARNLNQDRQRDRSLSGLIALADRVGIISPENGYNKVKYEYNLVNAVKEGNTYSFEDAFERIIFVYEKGTWRLDDVIKATTQGAKLPK
ncbi:hypothetical protein NQU47_01460 [Pseudoalteromonas distincta]|uniref:hypothetical protein n=1 Tax=Pseudoalteromonas distincta TaxID=77608 RepID=UPI00233F94D6|nr:hypothetical protein [Pseudoalteromonas distincta]MDC3211220.1 hypothetical protein [Pseudoalteromonas distincta]